ncbi:WbqC family protein [Maribacter algicola]|uniref:WbqC family protein n=1 Tax=Meishania litoralis TaxID=3434685 RepID=A0ACC7LN88_9FLAO
MRTLIHPTYFPSIGTFAVVVQKEIIWEVEDNYQKQTYRNRTYICNDRGKHLLNIPIRHVGGDQGRQKYKDVRVDNRYTWQRTHWRTLQTAYRTSPFFEYYEDDIAPLFESNPNFLLDFNLKTIATICDCLQIETPQLKTESFVPQYDIYKDLRFLVNAKNETRPKQRPYSQVFGDRHGFVQNASILDLLFNEGTNALTYLKQQDLKFLDV